MSENRWDTSTERDNSNNINNNSGNIGVGSNVGGDAYGERDIRSAFLDDLLTKEQNTCIEIRDICSGISNDAKEALKSGCTRDFIRTLKEQMQTLQIGIDLLDDTAGKKNMLEDEFVEKGTSEWLAKRFSSETRRRRLRGHRRKPKLESEEFDLLKVKGDDVEQSPPLGYHRLSHELAPLSNVKDSLSAHQSYESFFMPENMDSSPTQALYNSKSEPSISSSSSSSSTTTTATSSSSLSSNSSSSASSPRMQQQLQHTASQPQMKISNILN